MLSILHFRDYSARSTQPSRRPDVHFIRYSPAKGSLDSGCVPKELAGYWSVGSPAGGPSFNGCPTERPGSGQIIAAIEKNACHQARIAMTAMAEPVPMQKKFSLFVPFGKSIWLLHIWRQKKWSAHLANRAPVCP